MKSSHPSARRGFTLVELLCVFSIIALLGAILFTAFGSSRRRSHETVCLSNLRQIGQAIRMYQSDYDDDLPHELENIHPQQLSDARVFRCPVWVAVYESDDKHRLSQQKRFTAYAYEPAERRFWGTVPPEPGDPKSLSETWETKYKREGEHSKFVYCQYHDPNNGKRPVSSSEYRRIELVLYTDGSVGKRVTTMENGKAIYHDM